MILINTNLFVLTTIKTYTQTMLLNGIKPIVSHTKKGENYISNGDYISECIKGMTYQESMSLFLTVYIVMNKMLISMAKW